MIRNWMAGAALALAAMPGAALAQDGAKLDCVATSSTPDFKAQVGAAMAGAGDAASRDALFKQLGTIVDACVTQHGIADENKATYFDYSLARISREWLVGAIAKSKLQASVVDKALDFGPRGANPDLTGEMSDEQIGKIVGAYIDAGIDIETVDETVWEKVGAYAAATSIYWIKRKSLPY
ncbi:hypothetical protein [Sphingopyxis sp.]|uniref:hypothetical protein n=1 Tax=Sphingopyxis sp. TaxID=1908224 RepID=UPI003D0E2F42